MGSGAPRRYTSGMKLALLLSRHRRLLALCGLSAAVHLLVLELAARREAMPPSAPPAGEALSLRLVRRPVQQPPAPAPGDARPAAPPPATRLADPGGERPAEPEHTADAAVQADALPAAPPASAASAAPEPDTAGAPPVRMPGVYSVRLPDPVRLSYALNSQAPAAAPVSAGAASIAWGVDGEHYTLAVDGVLGRLRSEGVGSDTGLLPLRSGEERDGAMALSEFKETAQGAQDRASMLMQLAGMGQAASLQIEGRLGKELRMVVAGANGAEIARYLVMGPEQVTTGLGELAAWRLAQVAPPGRERLELWLAPDKDWLPVQLRLTRPDGSVLTQTVTRIDPGTPQ